LFRVKANQPTLYEGIALLFADPVSPLATVRQRDRHGDRSYNQKVCKRFGGNLLVGYQ